jgi:hypothetical protein
MQQQCMKSACGRPPSVKPGLALHCACWAAERRVTSAIMARCGQQQQRIWHAGHGACRCRVMTAACVPSMCASMCGAAGAGGACSHVLPELLAGLLRGVPAILAGLAHR